MSELAGKYKVLYVSGEESANQIKLRADRLGLPASDMMLYPETDMEDIRQQIADLAPDFVVIDSIQTMNEPSLDSMTGSASQVREVTSELMKIAKMDAITVFVIGHVTKEGAITDLKFWSTWLTLFFILKVMNTMPTVFCIPLKTDLAQLMKSACLKWLIMV